MASKRSSAQRIGITARHVLAARPCNNFAWTASDSFASEASDTAPFVEELDVVVIGGGVAGVGAAYRLKQDCPGASFVVLEKRKNIGGTWDLNRFPGVCSDLEMFSYAFEWHPWTDSKQLFCGGADILHYLDDVIATHDLGSYIRTNVAVHSASFISSERRWLVTTSSGTFLAKYLFAGMGYFDHDVPNEPELVGKEDFRGRIVHPQHWPEDLDLTGQRVVILGSGATAVSMAPAIARKAKALTLLQRTPTWVHARATREYWLPRHLRKISPIAANRLSAVMYPLNDSCQYLHAKALPSLSRRWFESQARSYLGERFKDYALPEHDPWSQRVCTTRDGEYWTLIREGRMRVVTDRVRGLSTSGVLCESGEELPADILITATGFNFQRRFPMNDVVLDVDGKPYDSGDTMFYKSVMLSDVPNLFTMTGYFHAAYTKRVDNCWTYACRLMNRMEEQGHSLCVVPRDRSVPEQGPEMGPSSGYFRRASQMGTLPKTPAMSTAWQTVPDPFMEGHVFKTAPLEDGVLRLS